MHDTLLPGSRNALRTADHAETQKIAISRPRPGDPLTMSHFGAPDSIRRRAGRPPFEGGPDPRILNALQGPMRESVRPFRSLCRRFCSAFEGVPERFPGFFWAPYEVRRGSQCGRSGACADGSVPPSRESPRDFPVCARRPARSVQGGSEASPAGRDYTLRGVPEGPPSGQGRPKSLKTGFWWASRTGPFHARERQTRGQ